LATGFVECAQINFDIKKIKIYLKRTAVHTQIGYHLFVERRRRSVVLGELHHKFCVINVHPNAPECKQKTEPECIKLNFSSG
jgi:hypothetical protein